MISAKPVTSAASASSYFFDADNYYLTDKSEIREASTWYGEGAKRLGIENDIIDEGVFSNMLQVLLPGGEQIGIMRDGSIKHRPATDITFSANKSIFRTNHVRKHPIGQESGLTECHTGRNKYAYQ